jgi:hypothetical protein
LAAEAEICITQTLDAGVSRRGLLIHYKISTNKATAGAIIGIARIGGVLQRGLFLPRTQASTG